MENTVHLETGTGRVLRLTGEGVCLKASTPAARVAGEELPSPDFRADGESTCDVAGIGGRAVRETAMLDGIELVRETFQSADGAMCAVRLSITNRRSTPFALESITPITAVGDEALTVADAGFADWRVLRMARQKNDIPGCFRPATHDADLADAAFCGGEIVAGMGVSPEDMARGGRTSESILADPCVIIRSDRKPDAPGLFLGILGQTEHLTSIFMTPSEGGDALGSLEVVCEFDGVHVDPGETRTTHWLLMQASADDYGTLASFADSVAREYGVPAPGPAPSICCNWYFYGSDMTQDDLDENLAVLAEKPIPFDVFLLDNGWMDNFGSWRPNERWPMGVKHAADCIARAGYRPGIWTCPFVVMAESPILDQYPDLVARDSVGEPCEFGYGKGVCYTVDPTAPNASAYFNEMFARLKGWGYLHHKFDFLRAVINARDVRFHDRKATRAQAYRRGLQLIRDALGPEAYIVACGGLFEGSAGLADAVCGGKRARRTMGCLLYWRGRIQLGLAQAEEDHKRPGEMSGDAQGENEGRDDGGRARLRSCDAADMPPACDSDAGPPLRGYAPPHASRADADERAGLRMRAAVRRRRHAPDDLARARVRR